MGEDPRRQSRDHGRQRGAETGNSKLVDTRSRELGGLAEGGRERRREAKEGQPGGAFQLGSCSHRGAG